MAWQKVSFKVLLKMMQIPIQDREKSIPIRYHEIAQFQTSPRSVAIRYILTRGEKSFVFGSFKFASWPILDSHS